MRNRVFICLSLLSLTWLGMACNFLEETPEDFLAPANFYQTEADALAAVTATYDHLASNSYYGQTIWNLGEVPSDLVEPGAGAPQSRVELNLYDYDGTNGIIQGLWRVVYQGINDANFAIERIPDIDMNPELRARLVAEARFLRGLFYFDLLRTYGGVPLLTTPTTSLENLNVSRNTASEVYQQVISDLQAAEAELPDSYPNAQVGRATKGAARALLARVYLYQGDFESAANKAREVTQMGYRLIENYEELWLAANENGPEHIFSVQYLAGVQGSVYMNQLGVRGGPFPLTGNSAVEVEQAFFDSFDPNDQRRDASIRDRFLINIGGTDSVYEFNAPHVWKFFDLNYANNPSDTDLNWPVLRYAEVLLILAEAINAQGGPNQEAYDALNQIRERANLEPLPAGLSQAAFQTAVEQERAWELCFEGHRFYDLARTGRLVEVMTASGRSVSADKAIYPIPQRELDTNPALVQNPGY